MYKETKYIVAGDRALVVEFGNEIKPEINSKIRALSSLLEDGKIEGIEEIVPTYRSILIIYDPLKIRYKDLVEELKALESKIQNTDEGEVRIVEIPTIYGGEYGPDIEFVAKHNNLSVEEVVEIHTGTDYLVYMLGFTPGFTYLGGMDERINTPRLESPRTAIPAGSAGIAGSQTGMYPIESPGGWQLIGRTPVKLYDPLNEEEPVLLRAGDYVRFVEIDEEEYKRIEKLANDRKYEVKILEGSELRENS